MKTWVLWHYDSPGVRVFIRRPGLLRRLGINRSAFATGWETRHNQMFFFPITDYCPPGTVDRTGR